jgi:excisionase family DNA binding protein
MEKKILLTKKDVQEYLHISHETLQRLMRKNAFPYIKMERKVLFKKEDIDAYLEAHIVK